MTIRGRQCCPRGQDQGQEASLSRLYMNLTVRTSLNFAFALLSALVGVGEWAANFKEPTVNRSSKYRITHALKCLERIY